MYKSQHMRKLASVVMLITAVGLVPAVAGELVEEEKVQRRGPLADLPSRTGPHIERIKALGDNQWASLGKPAADPKWGIARGRSWGGRSLTYAPDLGGAFFTGEGVHGYVKPDGYYMCDLWFYDANANRWICLYPGVHAETVRLKLDEHGFEVNQAGEHTPVGFLGHAYGSTTYDTDLEKFVVIYTAICYANLGVKHRQEWLGVPPEKRGQLYAKGNLNTSAKHPLFWDVDSGKWERRFVEAPGGIDRSREDGLAQYIPSLKRVMFSFKKETWFYDYQTNTWAGPEGKKSCPMQSYQNGCYDPKRDRVYVGSRNQFAYFDLKTKQWTEVKTEVQPETFDSTNTVYLAYDSANDVVVYCRKKNHNQPKGHLLGHIWVYDPATNKWHRPERTFPAKHDTIYSMVNGFYNAELNVHFFYLANDSSTKPGTMLVYRYKRAGK